MKVNVDFSDLSLDGCEDFLVLNEQGSTTFEKYSTQICLKNYLEKRLALGKK